MQIDLSTALRAAYLNALLARLDAGGGHAHIHIYSTTMPATPGTHSDTPLATFTLPTPAGSVAGGVLSFGAVDQTMVMSDGYPRWGEIAAADGAVLIQGDATDAANGGFFIVAGAPTPGGETSPYFYAGGLMALGSSALT